MLILCDTAVLSKIQNKEKWACPKDPHKPWQKQNSASPSVLLDRHTSTKGLFEALLVWRALLTLWGFRVVFLRSSNKEVKGLWALEVLGVLVGISLLMGWHKHNKLRKALLILGWAWGRKSVIPPWTARPQNKDNQCPAVPTLIAALRSETWKHPIMIPVSSLCLGAMTIVCYIVRKMYRLSASKWA